MIRWIMNLLKSKGREDGIVQYVRTEFGAEVKHLSNENCVGFYNHYLSKQRRK